MENEFWNTDIDGSNVIHFIRISDGGVMILFNGVTYPTSEISGYDGQITPTNLLHWVMRECHHICMMCTRTFTEEIVTRRNQLHVFQWGDHFYVLPTAFFIDLGFFLGKQARIL